MQRIFAVVLLCVGIFCLRQVNAQTSLTLVGVGTAGGGAAAYTGPGDVVSGAVAWWGLRCYNAAYSGNVVDITDSATGNTTGTRLQCSSGTVSALVSGSACTFVTGNACSTIAVTCAVACDIEELYDQSGFSGCSGACNLIQATNADRVTYTPTCSGLTSKPCMTFAAGQNYSSANFATTIAQPGTVSSVANRTFTGGFIGLTGTPDCGPLYTSSANTVANYCGASLNTVTATDATWHALQNIFNDPSSTIYVDGGAGAASSAGSSLFIPGAQALLLGGFTGQFIGTATEAGFWGSAFNTTQADNMNSNQHTYWGF